MSTEAFLAAVREFSVNQLRIDKDVMMQVLSEENSKLFISALDSNNDGYVSVIGALVLCAPSVFTSRLPFVIGSSS
jgi:hypothetical protein